jgi:phosphopantothenoylcysteine decarboxylase/phosphopantothenate--cysteine ligase
MSRIKRILITAGPTREMLDPVRFLSNLSTGEMGYALAREARRRNYQVTLISGPTSLQPPAGVRFVPIISAAELQKKCRKLFPKNDILIMTAAVCDFTAAHPSAQKIHRTQTKSLHLKQTQDIVAGLSKDKGRRTVIGFCLETQNWLGNAKDKIKRKNLDGIVANYYTKSHVPFGDRKITTAFLSRSGDTLILRKQSKKQIAGNLLKWTETLESPGPKKSFKTTGKTL